jgi:hypothetical protein
MERCWTLVATSINFIVSGFAYATYFGNKDGCKFTPEYLAPSRILGGIRRPNETAITKLILEEFVLGYSGGWLCQCSACVSSFRYRPSNQ